MSGPAADGIGDSNYPPMAIFKPPSSPDLMTVQGYVLALGRFGWVLVHDVMVWDIFRGFLKIYPTRHIWNYPIMHILEDDIFSVIGNNTHCTIEFDDSYDKYILKSHRGISTWFYTRLTAKELRPEDLPKTPILCHHAYFNKHLIPIGHDLFNFMETLAVDTWSKQHNYCIEGHFYVNIHHDGDHLVGPNAKFTTHLLCGNALVADLFQVVFEVSARTLGGDYNDPKDWQGLREVLWEEAELTIDGVANAKLGNFYSFKFARENRTTIMKTGWFKERSYVWLLPIKHIEAYDEVGFNGELDSLVW